MLPSFQSISRSHSNPEQLLQSPSSYFPFDCVHPSNPINRSSGTRIDELEFQESGNKRQISAIEDSQSSQIDIVRNLYTSYDIYGNELNTQNNVSLTPFDNYDEEDEIRSNMGGDWDIYDPQQENKENNDPVLNMITPLKKRNVRDNGFSRSSRQSSTRSPLVDITPPLVRKKSNKLDFKIEVRFFQYKETNSFLSGF